MVGRRGRPPTGGVTRSSRGRGGTMNPVYLGVDVAGAKNTWMMSLSPSSHGLAGVDGPGKASLAAVVGYCEGNNVVAATIDAQLTRPCRRKTASASPT